ncbi:MAG: excinuclease ABC subunit UvrC [Eubacteriales bacterium]|nr:excinuclease ABC subunit UvrC [Eubacteriales bacterium]
MNDENVTDNIKDTAHESAFEEKEVNKERLPKYSDADIPCSESEDESADESDAFDIKAELKKLPTKPGVYIMHGPKDEIIYVGKAVNLKNRVRQYFQSDKNKTDKIKKMISLIRRFEYIVVDSEMEALVLENNLIKENSPKYNTLLKDDKTYPYIKVTVGEHFPRVMMTRKVKKDRSRYFGPYTSGTAVRDTIDLMHKLFKIRSCSRRLPEDTYKERPCLYYHMGQCLGPCNAFISEEDYRRHIDRAVEFLSGKYDYVRKYLTDKMQTASDALEFERAIEYRELLNEIEVLASSQKVTDVNMDDRDIIGIGILGNDAAAQCFFIRDGRMIGRESLHLEVDSKDDISDILSAFITQFYSGTPYIPKEIWVQADIQDKELLEKWLSESKGRAVKIISPKRGDKERLVELAVKNADNQLLKDFEKLKREDKRTRGAQEEIRELLGLSELHRIESYDISNISGVNSVGSMVVFADGKPKNSDYRKFKIKTVKGPDDYASMREVLTRRFKRGISGEGESFSSLPDLIMMDGGRGQVNIALEVLGELGLDIPVSGMVKDDGHRTRGLYFNNKEIPIDTRSEAFKLITRVQDETHRFAIEYHRSLRSKEQVHSILDDIEGIGEVRRRALMKYFKSVDEIKKASIEELSEPEGMNLAAAESVYSFFH